MAKKNEKKRNENKRRLLLLILLLAVTISTLAVGTYAWFTANKKVNVENLDVQVRAVNGIEISADAVTWTTSINKDNLISNAWTNHTNQLPTYMSHASSSGKIDPSTHLLTMFDGDVRPLCTDGSEECENPTYTLATTRATERKCFDEMLSGSGGGISCNGLQFMAFDIFLKVDGTGSDLMITENATVNPIRMDYDLGVKNATRVAFVVQGNISLSEYYNGIEDENGDPVSGEEAARSLMGATDDSVVLWEPNYDAHTEFGVRAAREYYQFYDSLHAGNGNNQLEYEGVIGETVDAMGNPVRVPLTETNSEKYPNYFALIKPDLISGADSSMRVSQNTGIRLENGVTKIRVYFWIEGQDVDAENNATGSDMRLNLEFSIAE